MGTSVGDSDGQRKKPIISKPTGDEECQPQRIFKDPGMPSQKGIDEHEAGGHATDNSWCEASVEGCGIGELHSTGKGQESTIHVLAFDCLFATSADDIKTRGETPSPVMVFLDGSLPPWLLRAQDCSARAHAKISTDPEVSCTHIFLFFSALSKY